MQRRIRSYTALAKFLLIVVVAAGGRVHAQDVQTTYPSMAAVDQYLMERNAEIALAKSAAPESISRDAKVLVLGLHGYEPALKGKNGFVCAVLRSWTAGTDDPDFWNPKIRAAICFNAAAARTYLPITIKRTDLILAGGQKRRCPRTSNALSTRRNCLDWNRARCVT
jgi:hypothetical protein